MFPECKLHYMALFASLLLFFCIALVMCSPEVRCKYKFIKFNARCKANREERERASERKGGGISFSSSQRLTRRIMKRKKRMSGPREWRTQLHNAEKLQGI